MASCAVEVKRFVREKLDRKLVIGIAAATSSAVVLTYLYNKMRKRLSAAPDRSGRETHPIDPSNQSKIGQVKENKKRTKTFVHRQIYLPAVSAFRDS